MMGNPSRDGMTGPLAAYAPGFRAALMRQGYARQVVTDQLRLMEQLSHWLECEKAGINELTAKGLVKYWEARAREGHPRRRSSTSTRPLLAYLRVLGVVHEAEACGPPTALDQLLDDYCAYLVRERGLVNYTVHQYRDRARLFLAAWSGPEGLDLEGLGAADVTGFILRQSPRHGVGSAKLWVTALRSLLRFLHVEGRTAIPLAPAVPAIAGWRVSSLPRALEPDQVLRLLRSCDRRTATGRRDYAVLTLLVRLGLRSGEVSALELGDIRWREGEVVVSGKGNCEERLPMPVDVGEALVGYVRKGRPRVTCSKLFILSRAPRTGLCPTGVAAIVRRACRRAGLSEVGPHRLRHTTATEMLRAGAPLSEVAQVLRHRTTTTTAIYAKVDRTVLRTLAQPWPGGAA